MHKNEKNHEHQVSENKLAGNEFENKMICHRCNGIGVLCTHTLVMDCPECCGEGLVKKHDD